MSADDKKQQDIVRLTLSDSVVPDIHIDGLPEFEAGWVWLAGAGPGDPGLLTLHAVNALKQADKVVYDALVSEDILSLVRPEAELFYAGKRGGKPSWNQQDITDKLIELAKQGHRVLRLKGGDPFIFGRGGEEAQALVAADISFRMIPGISAGVGGLGYAGIPATHRDVNHAVTFVTGHLAGKGEAELLDWASIAKASPVIVIYMAMSRLAVIADLLMQAGRSADEPVAIVTHATTPRQRIATGRLADAAQLAADNGLEPPSIIVIGAVVDLAETLHWFGDKPV
ncbi:uroporphyrinogen-III C-methyltransferase [Alphaproteobacteria bacterium]|jgi:uroporphyrin-III C-methyltransferase|nr:uroporphyrinogen-III C-methyltransferase [PS1 clade bacterium]MDA8624810.1 uroporphyrinogen-III C-methyltransferase [Alphaproteobacteria bacterium]MBL6783461.1 uroporphyrinogen-III C-methyltransferase [PS1 clade bacterium]MDB2405906.1 uroporphyrinogen-III C-methyltransferase [Alphaproteobacteria bacterium]MDB2406193.1 uroporphyrinogen-III C-methyltransferase [Alphaproteobacteria bacterium]